MGTRRRFRGGLTSARNLLYIRCIASALEAACEDKMETSWNLMPFVPSGSSDPVWRAGWASAVGAVPEEAPALAALAAFEEAGVVVTPGATVTTDMVRRPKS